MGVRRFALFAAGVVAAIAVAGCAAAPAPAPRGGTVQACTAYAYQVIARHEMVTAVPAACDGLSKAQVNQAASTAIRVAAGSGPKSAWRARTASAAPWVRALLTGPAPAGGAGTGQVGPSSGSAAGGSLLGGGSELAVTIAALLGWLITASSGGYVVVRWWRAGGRLRRRTVTAVSPVVMLGHAGLGLLGLVLWTVFAATGSPALAWMSVGLLAPVAGLGMSVLVIGLPSPRTHAGPARAPARSGGHQPVLVIALHGLFAVTTLLLVITAAVGAG